MAEQDTYIREKAGISTRAVEYLRSREWREGRCMCNFSDCPVREYEKRKK